MLFCNSSLGMKNSYSYEKEFFFNQHGCCANHHMKSDGIPVGLLAELRWNFLHIPSRLRLMKPNQESKIRKSISVFTFSAFMHLHWSAKTSSKNCYYEMLLKITLEMSLNIKEMLRFICKRQRHLLHSYFEIWLVAPLSDTRAFVSDGDLKINIILN